MNGMVCEFVEWYKTPDSMCSLFTNTVRKWSLRVLECTLAQIGVLVDSEGCWNITFGSTKLSVLQAVLLSALCLSRWSSRLLVKWQWERC